MSCEAVRAGGNRSVVAVILAMFVSLSTLSASAQSIADFYQTTIPHKLQALRELPGDALIEPLDFFGAMKMPRVNFVGFANNHSVHHRGQLAAYLRAMGSKVPNIYGPSADAEPASA